MTSKEGKPTQEALEAARKFQDTLTANPTVATYSDGMILYFSERFNVSLALLLESYAAKERLAEHKIACEACLGSRPWYCLDCKRFFKIRTRKRCKGDKLCEKTAL